MKTQPLYICLAGFIALTNTVRADDINFGKKKVSSEQVIEALNPKVANPDTVPTDDDYEGDIKQNGQDRSIDMSNLAHTKVNKPLSKSKPIHGKGADSIGGETALSMEIVFGYKSAELTDLGKESLKPVGEALASDKLNNFNFIVEGHTDAVGSDAYNLSLSEKRAASVKQFLVDTYKINPSHIQVLGKGKNGLLDPKNPDSEINRRVRIIAKK